MTGKPKNGLTSKDQSSDQSGSSRKHILTRRLSDPPEEGPGGTESIGQTHSGLAPVACGSELDYEWSGC